LDIEALRYLQVLLEVSGGLARRQLDIDALQDTPESGRAAATTKSIRTRISASEWVWSSAEMLWMINSP
jgi:hypothetical protein